MSYLFIDPKMFHFGGILKLSTLMTFFWFSRPMHFEGILFFILKTLLLQFAFVGRNGQIFNWGEIFILGRAFLRIKGLPLALENHLRIISSAILSKSFSSFELNKLGTTFKNYHLIKNFSLCEEENQKPSRLNKNEYKLL